VAVSAVSGALQLPLSLLKTAQGHPMVTIAPSGLR
jgi:hypothetical protein